MVADVDRKKLFERLSASLIDFGQARFCARHLLKKGWHSMPWERRPSRGTIYEQQNAFVTNLIVAYARPFTKSKGWPSFPSELINFDSEQQEIHQRIILKRHQIFAHSDSEHYSFEPWTFGAFRTTIESVPSAILSAEETTRIEKMTENLIAATVKKLDELYKELAVSPDDVDVAI